MLSNAFLLMIVGMSIVFIFLTIVRFSIGLLTTLYKKEALAEAEQIAQAERTSKKAARSDDYNTLVAVISSAIHRYRQSR